MDFKTGINYTYEYTCSFDINHPLLKSKGSFSLVYLLRKEEDRILKRDVYFLDLLEVKNVDGLSLDRNFLLLQQRLFGKIQFALDGSGFPGAVLNYAQLLDLWLGSRGAMISRYPDGLYKRLIINLDKLLSKEEPFTKLIFSEGIVHLMFPKIEIRTNDKPVVNEGTDSFRLIPGISLSVNRQAQNSSKDLTSNRVVKIKDTLSSCTIGKDLLKKLFPSYTDEIKLQDINLTSVTDYEFSYYKDLKQIRKSIDFQLLEQLNIQAAEELNLVSSKPR